MTNDISRELDLLKFYRGEIRFESDVLSGRLNAFISSQAFLVIAYASSMSSSNGRWSSLFTVVLPPCLALLGLALALLARPGIRAVRAVIDRWRIREAELVSRSHEISAYTLVGDQEGRLEIGRRRREGVLFAERAPVVFIVAWCWFILLPLYFFVSS